MSKNFILNSWFYILTESLFFETKLCETSTWYHWDVGRKSENVFCKFIYGILEKEDTYLIHGWQTPIIWWHYDADFVTL